MNHRIIQASDFALHILKNKRNGEIHSVYRKTINIRMDGVLLALQACQSPVSPISLITELTEDSMKDLHLQEGTAVTVTDSSVNLGSHAFSFHDSEIIQTELKETLSFSCIQLLKEHLKTVILSSHTGGFDTIFLKPIIPYWIKIIHLLPVPYAVLSDWVPGLRHPEMIFYVVFWPA